MEMFAGPAPPLLPVVDAAELLGGEDLGKIERARLRLGKRFPQFRWCVFTVSLPEETSLPVFGFWLLNACPLGPEETADERAFTVLLLINAETGRAAVIPGYGAEPFLADDEWKQVLASMTPAWQAGKPGAAVVDFLAAAHKQLDHAWKRYGIRK